MSEVLGRPRAIALLAALAITALALGACGDDDSSDPASLAIEATGSEGSIAYEAPSEAEAGATEIEFTNSTDLDTLDAQLGFVAEGSEHSDEEVVQELGNAFRGQPVADWFQGGGGVGSTPEGETGTVTQDLEPGTYYVLGGEDLPEPPLVKFTVSGDGGAELPDPDGTVTAGEYVFTSDGLPSGQSTLLLDNKGAQWHHFLASRLKDDATIEQAKRYLLSEGEGGGPVPFEGGAGEPENAVESTVLEGGTAQLVDVELEPGRYAFFCFIADKQGGPPHVVKGMVSEVEVSE